MNQLDISFEIPAWESVLGAIPAGTAWSGARFLTLMETQSEETVEEAFSLLRSKDVLLDISDLPAQKHTGDTAVRLRREAELVRSNQLPQALEENDPLRLYLQEVAEMPACGDVQLLAQQYLQGDESVIAQLTNSMLGLVIEKAFAMAGQGVLLLDLIQEGSLGLWQAILDYTGGDFAAFCTRRIEMILANAVVQHARASGVGQKLRQALEDYREIEQQLLMELGRTPTVEEIAHKMHISPEEAASVQETLDSARMLESVRKEAPKEESEEDTQAVEDTAYFQLRQRIQELLSCLSEEDVKLLTLRFGLEGGLPASPEQTGRILGLTPEQVLTREAAALAQLRTTDTREE